VDGNINEKVKIFFFSVLSDVSSQNFFLVQDSPVQENKGYVFFLCKPIILTLFSFLHDTIWLCTKTCRRKRLNTGERNIFFFCCPRKKNVNLDHSEISFTLLFLVLDWEKLKRLLCDKSCVFQ